MSAIRMDRLNEEIKQVLSEIVREMKDPRVSPMTIITQVEITPDLKYAKAKVSVYDKDDQQRLATVEALNHASRHIVHELGQRMQIRRLPQMKFILDTSIEYSAHISKILNDLKVQDGQNENTDD